MCTECSPEVCDCLCTEIPIPVKDMLVTVSGMNLWADQGPMPGGSDDCMLGCRDYSTQGVPLLDDGPYRNLFVSMSGQPFVLRAVYSNADNLYPQPIHRTFSPINTAPDPCEPTSRPFKLLPPPLPGIPVYESCPTRPFCSGFNGEWVWGEEYINSDGETDIRGKLYEPCSYAKFDGLCLVVAETRVLISFSCAENYAGSLSISVSSTVQCSGVDPPLLDECAQFAQLFDPQCIRGVGLPDEELIMKHRGMDPDSPQIISCHDAPVQKKYDMEGFGSFGGGSAFTPYDCVKVGATLVDAYGCVSGYFNASVDPVI